MQIVLKRGDEWFVGPSSDKRKAYAHLGIDQDTACFVVIDAPFYLEPTSPFDYGQGTTTVPLESQNVGMAFTTNCWGVCRQEMFSIIAIDECNKTLCLEIVEGLTLLPRDERDHRLSAFHD